MDHSYSSRVILIPQKQWVLEQSIDRGHKNLLGTCKVVIVTLTGMIRESRQKGGKGAKKIVVGVDRTPDLSKSLLKSGFSRTLSQLSYPDVLLIGPQTFLHIANVKMKIEESSLALL